VATQQPPALPVITAETTRATAAEATVTAAVATEAAARISYARGTDVTHYGAVDDCLTGFPFATWASNGSTLTIYMSNALTTVTNTGPNGVAVLTIPGAYSSSAGSPSQSWVGKPIAIAGAGTSGGTFVGRVTSFYFDPNNSYYPTVVLNTAVPTPFTATTKQVSCPCFVSGSDNSGLPTCVGASIWVATGGGVSGLNAQTTYACQYCSTIATYVSPFSVTVTAAFTSAASPSAVPTLIEWGTNNTTAVLAAAAAALAAGKKDLLFTGLTLPQSTGRFGVFNYCISEGAQNAANFPSLSAVSALNWISRSCSVYVTEQAMTGSNYYHVKRYKGAIPESAGAMPPVKISINGDVDFPRCATLNTIVVLVVGDSWSAQDPSGTGNAVWEPFARNFSEQNHGKKIYFVCAGSIGLTWNGLTSTIAGASPVTVAGLGSVVPDLVCLFVTGGNDGNIIIRNDILTCINTVKGWATKNGYPPDVLLLTGTYPRTYEAGSISYDTQWQAHEYCTLLQRSIARVRGFPILDLARHGAFALRGWSEDALPIRVVPSLPAATAGTVGSGYVVPYLCRDFFFAIALGTSGSNGTTFWSTAGTVQITISPKPDNRIVLSVDSSHNLNVTAVTFGMTVATPVAMTSGSAAITTSGQTALTPVAVNVYQPAFGVTGSGFVSGMLGQCLIGTGAVYCGNEDYRTWVAGYTNGSIVAVCDGNQNSGTPSYMGWGGQFFVAGDAVAQNDCIVAGAGNTYHPLTGANSLVTTVAAYTSKTQATLAANAVNTVAATENMFLGSISVQPTYSTAVAAGADSGAQPVLTIQKSGTRIKIGYMMGGHLTADPRTNLQAYETLVWEGDVEVFGSMFFPKIYCGAASTVQIVYAWIDDQDAVLVQPRMTMREAFGTIDPNFSYPFGGDGGHPSHAFLRTVIDEVSAAQPLGLPNNYANNFATVVATTSGYTIPANQSFTDLTPAGTLATCPTTLPSVFPPGGRLEIFTSQVITSWVISAPSGFTIAGPTVSAATAGQTVAFRLTGTVWTRVL
jgi:hypothetical protein